MNRSMQATAIHRNIQQIIKVAHGTCQMVHACIGIDFDGDGEYDRGGESGSEKKVHTAMVGLDDDQVIASKCGRLSDALQQHVRFLVIVIHKLTLRSSAAHCMYLSDNRELVVDGSSVVRSAFFIGKTNSTPLVSWLASCSGRSTLSPASHAERINCCCCCCCCCVDCIRADNRPNNKVYRYLLRDCRGWNGQ
jgi:hypothetical protein